MHKMLYSVGYSETVSKSKYTCQISQFYMTFLTFSGHLFFFPLQFTKLNNLLIYKAQNNHSRDLSSFKFYGIFAAHLNNKETTTVPLLPISKTHRTMFLCSIILDSCCNSVHSNISSSAKKPYSKTCNREKSLPAVSQYLVE